MDRDYKQRQARGVVETEASGHVPGKQTLLESDGHWSSPPMQKWERWLAKTVTLEQDGSGTYSGAWQRAQTYARAGSAFCDAARLAAWQLIELGRVIGDPQVTDALRPLGDGFTCAVSGPAESPNERTIFLGDWDRQKSMAVAAARDGVAACFKKFGGTPPLVHAPSIWVTLEAAEKEQRFE